MILLDTCALLWLAADQAQLSKLARAEIGSHAGQIYVMAMTAFEIGVKHRKGHLELPMDPRTYYERTIALHGVREVAVTGAIAVRSTQLPLLHRDPIDRLIVAAAQLEGLTVLTPDPAIKAYPNTRVVW